MTKELKIMPELQEYLDVSRDTEKGELEKSIIAEGVRDPIVIWKEEQVIIDGHTRYGICVAHNLDFPSVERSFENIEEVKDWMLMNQLGRRNLSPERFSYFLGLRYNREKQKEGPRTKIDGPNTAERLAEEHGVSERTVRRAAQTAMAIDVLERIKGKAAKTEQLEGKGNLTKEDLTTIGKVAEKEPEVAAVALRKLDEIKSAEKAAVTKAKDQKKKIEAAAKEKKETYLVSFLKPEFDRLGFRIDTEVKPPMSDNAVVYMYVPDEEMPKALALFERWNLTYEGSFVFPIEGYEGTWSDVRHAFLVVGTKGTVAVKNANTHSMITGKEGTEGAMIRLIEKYHPEGKRLDMRKAGPAKGWESLAKPA